MRALNTDNKRGFKEYTLSILQVMEAMLNKEFKTIKEVIEELNRRITEFGNNENSDFFSWILNNIVIISDFFWKAKKLFNQAFFLNEFSKSK